MIRIANIRQINNGSVNWIIVRSIKSVPNGAIWVPDLSPSKELFYTYLQAKNEGKYNADWFGKHYVPRFLQEIKNNPNAIRLLAELCAKSQTEDITLSCFCTDEETCHRSIVAGLLLGSGAAVDCKDAYKRYYDMYLER